MEANTSNIGLADRSTGAEYIPTSLDNKEKIKRYLKNDTSEKISTANLSRIFGITRQGVWRILEDIGETRHRRPPKVDKQCEICQVPVSRNATFCRTHSRNTTQREPGKSYQCRLCQEYKVLEQFAKNKQYQSGYETRCLKCRAEWQRNYHQTERGKKSHSLSSSTLTKRHPERQRAYYQIYHGLQKGTIVKKPCESCGSENVKAVHKDYNNPFDVTWLCALCRHRSQPNVVGYVPNPLEENLREFIVQETGFNRWSTKWILILKEHYNTQTLTKSHLDSSKDDATHVKGLGKTYREVIEKFLTINCGSGY